VTRLNGLTEASNDQSARVAELEREVGDLVTVSEGLVTITRRQRARMESDRARIEELEAANARMAQMELRLGALQARVNQHLPPMEVDLTAVDEVEVTVRIEREDTVVPAQYVGRGLLDRIASESAPRDLHWSDGDSSEEEGSSSEAEENRTDRSVDEYEDLPLLEDQGEPVIPPGLPVRRSESVPVPGPYTFMGVPIEDIRDYGLEEERQAHRMREEGAEEMNAEADRLVREGNEPPLYESAPNGSFPPQYFGFDGGRYPVHHVDAGILHNRRLAESGGEGAGRRGRPYVAARHVLDSAEEAFEYWRSLVQNEDHGQYEESDLYNI